MRTSHAGRPTRLALAGIAALLASCLAVAPASAAKKLRFFSKQVSSSLTDASGNPITNPNTPPAAGDRFVVTDLDYVGNHRHHAKRWTASDHFACTFTTPPAAICSGQIAIAGSMLFSDNVPLDFANPSATVTVPITGGTGRYRGAKGTVTSVSVGKTNNSNLTITLTG